MVLIITLFFVPYLILFFDTSRFDMSTHFHPHMCDLRWFYLILIQTPLTTDFGTCSWLHVCKVLGSKKCFIYLAFTPFHILRLIDGFSSVSEPTCLVGLKRFVGIRLCTIIHLPNTIYEIFSQYRSDQSLKTSPIFASPPVNEDQTI